MMQVVTPQNLGNEFDLGVIEANKIHIKVDGTTIVRNGDGSVTALGQVTSLSLAGAQLTFTDETGSATVIDLAPAVDVAETVTTLAYDAASTTLTFTDEDGHPTTVDLGALTSDIHVDGASWDAASMTLTLTDNDGSTPDVVVDLSSLQGSMTDNGDGTYLYDAGDGTQTTINTNTPASADAGNLLATGSDGRPLLDQIAIAALATVDVQDAFGNHLYYAFP
ncbi:MAG: hypothetical protein KDE46_22360 [Caldilineaceae bacterium]|nr:hypothetical protein [Caldilineaceae bacterium]